MHPYTVVDGGACAVLGGEFTATGVAVTGHRADRRGGAVVLKGGSAQLTRCEFADNAVTAPSSTEPGHHVFSHAGDLAVDAATTFDGRVARVLRSTSEVSI